jgi:hypothetical protein
MSEPRRPALKVYHTHDGRQAWICRATSMKQAAETLGTTVSQLRSFGGLYHKNDGTYDGKPIPDGAGPFYTPLMDYCKKYPVRSERWRLCHEKAPPHSSYYI